MAQIREIKKRMVAVRTIQRITKTMQMIATAKFTAAQQRARASRDYTDAIRALCADVSAAAGDAEHPLLQNNAPEGAGELLLVLSSDRGLCGAYNSNVFRQAMHVIRAARAAGRPLAVESNGKKAVGFFKFQRVDVAQRHTLGDKPKWDAVQAIAQRYIDAFSRGEFSAIRVAYMRFVSTSRQVPEVMQLLPFARPEAGGGEKAHALVDFSPSPEALLADVLPRAVAVSLYQAVLDSAVSEHVMRMVAMKAATDNASGLGRTLRRGYNRARQARITTELTEIVSGAAALA